MKARCSEGAHLAFAIPTEDLPKGTSMETVRYEMMIFADADGTMPQERIHALTRDLAEVGGDAAVLEMITSQGPQSWGLRAVIRSESE